MTWERPQWEHSFPQVAASNIVPNVPVKPAATTGRVTLSATNTDKSVGVTHASAASLDPVTVKRAGVVGLISTASIGAGTEVGVASTNGAVGAITAASGMDKQALGITQHAAAGGEIVAVELSFRSVQTGGG